MVAKWDRLPFLIPPCVKLWMEEEVLGTSRVNTILQIDYETMQLQLFIRSVESWTDIKGISLKLLQIHTSNKF